MSAESPPVEIRQTRAGDFDGIIDLCRRVYPSSMPWASGQLASHLAVFPEGQLVAVEGSLIVGMAASLIVLWDEYDEQTTWREFTVGGTFSNHDPERGRTLYGAEVMVDPTRQGAGIGSRLYEARRELVVRLGLRRIRAGARLRGYHEVADRLTPEEYVDAVERRDLSDPTLSFQLNRGFRVIAVVSGYLKQDPESLGHAAIIEWSNPAAAPVEIGPR